MARREVGSGTGIEPVPYHLQTTFRAVSASVRRASDAVPMDWRCGQTLRCTCEGTCWRQNGAGGVVRLAGNTQHDVLCVADESLLAPGHVHVAACTLTGAGTAK